MDRRQLGETGIMVSPIGLGCWQFASSMGPMGTFWQNLDQQRIADIVRASLDLGITWFDTAEAYGGGESERSLSAALRQAGVTPGKVTVATKWFPLFRVAGSIGKTFPLRREALSPYPVDLYQVHHPFSLSSVEKQMDGMAALVKNGAVRAVGVSNFSAGLMRRAHNALARHGVVLATNQVRYSLLDRRNERNGVLAEAERLGVTIIAYSPLAQGVLTGKFHDNPEAIASRPGPRKWMRRFKSEGLEKSRPLIEALRRIAERRGCTPAQVALAWVTHRPNVVAIPGASSREQAEANARAMDVALDEEEYRLLSSCPV